MYMAHVCFDVGCSDCVGSVGMFVVWWLLLKIVGFFSLGVLKNVVCLCRGCDGCCVCIVRRGAVGARVWGV